MTDAEKILAALDEVRLPRGAWQHNLDALNRIRTIAQAQVDAQLEAVVEAEQEISPATMALRLIAAREERREQRQEAAVRRAREHARRDAVWRFGGAM